MRILANWRGRSVPVLTLLAIMVSGCAGTIDITSKTRIDVERPAGRAAIPIAVGIYFSPEFLAFEDHPRNPIGKDQMIVRFGQTSADLFDGVFSAAFEEVQFVGARPPLPKDAPKVIGVIEPRIEQATVYGKPADYTADLVYHFRLYDPAGSLVLSWNISAQGRYKPGGLISFGLGIRPAQDDAMIHAGENLMSALFNDPQITQWLKIQGIDLAGQ